MDCIVFEDDNVFKTLVAMPKPEFSFTMWLLVNSETGNRYLVSQHQLSIIICGQEICISSNFLWIHTKVYIPLNIWTHICVIYDYHLKQYKIYMDDKLMFGALESYFKPTKDTMCFGQSFNDDKKLVKMSQMGLFLKTLLPEEINKVKHGDYTGAFKWWPFNNLIEGIINLCHNDHMVQVNMVHLINNPKHSDIKIHCNDGFIYSHKVIICHQCPVLDNMITSENEITLPIPYHILYDFITYLYTGSSTFINDQNVLSLFTLSDEYIIDLKYECEQYMSYHLTMNNIFDYYKLSQNHNAFYLSNQCIQWMISHKAEVTNNPLFHKLDSKTYCDILKKMINL